MFCGWNISEYKPKYRKVSKKYCDYIKKKRKQIQIFIYDDNINIMVMSELYNVRVKIYEYNY